jgi:hypothetical protein
LHFHQLLSVMFRHLPFCFVCFFLYKILYIQNSLPYLPYSCWRVWFWMYQWHNWHKTHHVYLTLIYLLLAADSAIKEKFCTEDVLRLMDETKQIVCYLTYHRVGLSANCAGFSTG